MKTPGKAKKTAAPATKKKPAKKPAATKKAAAKKPTAKASPQNAAAKKPHAKRPAAKKPAAKKPAATKKAATKPAAKTVSGKMDEAVFWKVIGRFDWKKTGDDDEVMAPAAKALAAMSEADIFRFDDILAEKLHALDTREHCRGAYDGTLDPDDPDDYISADDFLYTRCCVVANGKKRYELALENPKKMIKDLEFESILYLAQTAYEDKTGDDDYPHSSPVSFESFQNDAGWAANANTKKGKFTSAKIPPGNRRPA